MAKWVNLAVRLLIAVVLGVLLLRFAEGAPVMLLLMGVAYAAVLFLLFGISFLQQAGHWASRLYEPSDENIPVVPEYSVAEARAKEGKYTEAVAEYHKVIEKFPGDVYAHVRIAELSTEHLHDFKLAETELLAAQAKAVQEDVVVLVAHRLADLYQHQLNSSQRGLDVLLNVKGRLTNARHLRQTEERIEFLRQLADGHQVPQSPKNIQLRKSRYQMHD